MGLVLAVTLVLFLASVHAFGLIVTATKEFYPKKGELTEELVSTLTQYDELADGVRKKALIKFPAYKHSSLAEDFVRLRELLSEGILKTRQLQKFHFFPFRIRLYLFEKFLIRKLKILDGIDSEIAKEELLTDNLFMTLSAELSVSKKLDNLKFGENF